ncbi:MAG: adenylyltransferase/cytidyltransferase family protein [Verrucomicrobiota bacterium]
MKFRDKILTAATLKTWREQLRSAGKKLVVTNGCFDLLHLGHVTYLHAARELGDALLIGLNGDESVRLLKGEGRPINPELDRAAVLAALEMVDGVCIFPEKTATRFLGEVAPDIYVKGGDYTVDSLNKDERQAVEGASGRIIILPIVPGKSTTSLVEKIVRF